MAFRPNVAALLHRSSVRNIHGETTRLPAVPIMIGIVRLTPSADKTTIRADSSATQGNADELTIKGSILALPGVGAKVGDTVEVAGVKVKISGVEPRFSVAGLHDHDQLSIEAPND